MPHPVHLAPTALADPDNTSDHCRNVETENLSPTYRISLRASRAWDRLFGSIFSRARHAGDEGLVTRNDVDEKVEVVGLAERLGDVCAR